MRRAFAWAVAMGAVSLAGQARAEDVAKPEPWTAIAPGFLIENDSVLLDSDRHFTSGLYASATSGRRTDCEFCIAIADATMFGNGDGATYHYGVFAGQSMFTPEKISISPPDSRDRPYAGWLFVGGRVYREKADVLDRVEVSAGVVGPGSGADAVQRWWHALHWFGGAPPLGWHAQIKDEPGLVLTEQRVWRVNLTKGPIEAELLPEVNASVGNVLNYAAAGATFRIGGQLDTDWGPARIEPAMEGSDFVHFKDVHGIAWYLFAGFEGRAIARNIFLDGNSFQHSANVTKLPFVADFNAGAAIICDHARVSLSYTNRTREFETQNGDDRFLSFSVAYSY